MAANTNRLLFGNVSDADLMARATTTHRHWWRMLRSMADWMAGQEPGPALGSARSLGRDTLWYRQLGDGICNLAMAYRVSGSEKYLDAATRYIDFATRIKVWGGDLEHGHLLGGFGLAMDWLWDDLPSRTRRRLIARLLVEGDGMSSGTVSGGWWCELYTQNHYWVNMTGLALAGWALRRRMPEHRKTAQKWLRNVHKGFDKTFERMPDDGSFHEMGAYYLYGLKPMVMYATGAEWEDGIMRWEHGYLKRAGAFMCHTATPSGRLYAAFGDSEQIVSGQGSLARLAAQYRDGGAQWLAEIRLVPTPWKRAPEESLICSYFQPDRILESYMGVVWYDPKLSAKPPRATGAFYKDTGLAIARNRWAVDSSGFIAKCGPWGGHKIAEQGLTVPEGTSTSHADPDNMSFFYYCRGKEIISDADYEMRKSTASHNTIMLEEHGQHGHGIMWPELWNYWPSMLEMRRDAGWTYAACDGTDAYPGSSTLKLARRHFIFRDEVLVIADELESFGHLYFRNLLHTYGRVRLTETGAVITCGKVAVAVDVLWPPAYRYLEVSDRIVVARQGYGHDTVTEVRGKRITIHLSERRPDVRFLVVLRPVDVQASAEWKRGSDRITVTVEGRRRSFRLSKKPGMRPRTSCTERY